MTFGPSQAELNSFSKFKTVLVLKPPQDVFSLLLLSFGLLDVEQAVLSDHTIAACITATL